MKIYGAGRATSKPSNGTKIQDFFFNSGFLNPESVRALF